MAAPTINNPWMVGAYGVQGAVSLVNSFISSSALRRQGAYQAKMMELNARLAEYQAGDAIRRGERTADEYEKKLSGLLGSQRVALAASGVQLGEGSAAEIQADTAARGADDVVTIRSNAWREAWGYRAQAADYRAQGGMAQMAARNSANQTILGGITTAADSFLKAGWTAWSGDGNMDRRYARYGGANAGWRVTDQPLTYAPQGTAGGW